MSESYYHSKLSRRGVVRLSSFALAGVLVLGGSAIAGWTHAERYRIALENGYSQSLTGLAANLSNIANTLDQGLYASTPVQISVLSAQLWKDASAAKATLTGLPISELHLDGTNHFLSQVGDYAMALSRKSVSGQEISEQEREQFAALCDYGRALSEQAALAEQGIISGAVTMESIQEEIRALGSDEDATLEPGGGADSLLALEDAFADYPELVYDGPFSDHLLTRTPRMTQNAAVVSPEEAQKRAASVAGISPDALARESDEESQLPSYVFSNADTWVSISKQGGYPVYLLRSRLPGESTLTREQALQKAQEFLTRLGLSGLSPTWVQAGGGVCTVNFACKQGEVLIYPDLIKVEVALDNGEILAFDMRGYLTNHTARELPQPGISDEQARAAASGRLTVEASQLAVIPTSGQNEVLCYELACSSDSGERVFAYINAQTGMEEKLLVLPQENA